MDTDQFFVYFAIGFPIFMVTTMICTFTWVWRRSHRMMHDAIRTALDPASHPRPGHSPYRSSSDSPGYSSYDHGQGASWHADSHHSSYSDSSYSDSSSYSSSSCDTSSSSSSSDSSSSSC